MRPTKRTILNVSSKKKRDTMVTTTNVSPNTPVGGTTYAGGPAIFGAAGVTDGHCFVFVPTARDFTRDLAGVTGFPSDVATRTATTCYMRGVSEKIEVQVADGVPWQWRRICFTIKGTDVLLPTTPSFSPFLETSSGFTRVINQPGSTTRTNLEALLFKGNRNQDWSSVITAPIDTARVTPRYDKTITIASGNDSGVIRKYSRWHPMNKNLVYDDDEAGGTENAPGAKYSVVSKPGMGDYIIVDYFVPRYGAVLGNQMTLSIGASLYWHER